ncbi:MAG TPA: tetratricopeptide repeat protein [Vicinamibacterales bacterium]|nr:tetratricopeptide repeat protein [Vicinamibacterales bacterium]
MASAVALTAVVLTYSNHFSNDFHFDDEHTIQNNLFVRDLANIPRFFRDPATFSSLPANQSYRPFLTTTLAVDYRLAGGLKPVMFHITSFTLFLMQCIALLALYRRLMDHSRPHDMNRWLALFAAAWYALHTAIAETVNYIIARSDILSTLGTVLTVVMYASGGRARTWHLYLIPAAAAVLSKEQGAMAAPILFVYTALFERQVSLRDLLRPREFFATLRPVLPAFVVCTGILLFGMWLSVNFTPGGSRVPYLITQPSVLLHYALMFVAPVHLSADADWRPFTTVFDGRVLAGLLFIAAATWTTFVTSRRRATRPIAFGILWFFLALVPTSSVIPLAEVMNDHRMYFPFVGAVLSVTWALGLALSRLRPTPLLTPAVTIAAIAVLAAHAAGTWQRNIVWRTEESLWRDVTVKSPRNGRGLMTYGVIQMAKGNFSSAEDYFNRALQYSPQYAYLHVNLGVLKGAQGKTADAERHFRDAQKYDPRNPVSYFYYARWLASMGRTEEAAGMARIAVELSPAHIEAQQLLKSLATPATATPEQWLTRSLHQYQAGLYAESIASSQEALKLRPSYAEAFNNLCAAHNALKQFADAIAACERALALKPDFPLARNNLAYARVKQNPAP